MLEIKKRTHLQDRDSYEQQRMGSAAFNARRGWCDVDLGAGSNQA